MNQKKLSVNLYVATEFERETRFVTVEAHRSVCICSDSIKIVFRTMSVHICMLMDDE